MQLIHKNKIKFLSFQVASKNFNFFYFNEKITQLHTKIVTFN